MKQALTPQQLAVLAAGGKLGASAQTTTETKPATGAGTDVSTTEEPSANTDNTTASTETTTSTETTATSAPDQGAVIALLKEQVSAAQAEVVDLKVDLKASKDKLAAMEAAQAGLVKIAADSLNNMRIALNMPSVKCEGLSVEVLLKDHAAACAQFTDVFKVGGVAATSAVETLKPTPPDNLSKARVQATRI